MAEVAAAGTAADAKSPRFDPALVPGVIGAELARHTGAIDGVLNAFRRTRSITRSQMGTLRTSTAAIQRISMYSQQLSRLAGGRLRQSHERVGLDELMRRTLAEVAVDCAARYGQVLNLWLKIKNWPEHGLLTLKSRAHVATTLPAPGEQ